MDTLIGRTIDNYRILEVIGRGGMGVVLKAVDTNLEKIVALKMIDPFLAQDENFIKRFKTEAKALAKLANPNIVIVHAFRETESGFFMVMEYVDAKPLSQHLADVGPLSIKDILSISKQLLNAIKHAHEFGIIHRDIKPSNILLCYDGKIKVTDFGLAKVIQQKGPASTVTQARAGTLYYMSPEQVKGLKNVDIRSDIYSIGMTIYEMTTGRIPFEKTASDFTIQKQIVEGQFPSPVKFNAGIPKKLTKIILKAVDKDPDKRYKNADAMLDDILNIEKKILDEQSEIRQVSGIKEKQDKKSDSSKRTSLKLNSFFNTLKIFFQHILLYPIKFLNALIKKPVILFSSGIIILFMVLYMFFSSEVDEFITSIFSSTPVEEVVYKEDISSNEIQKQESSVLADSLTDSSLTDQIFDRLYIETKPSGANIYLDGKLFGRSNRLIDSLEIKTHRLLLRSKNYSDTSLIIDLSRTKSISVTLTPKIKPLINSDPEGADLFIDDISFGKTPLSSKEVITPGTHRIIIAKTGYKSIEMDIHVKDDKSFEPIFKKLEPILVKLEITVQPSGSRLYIDNKEKVPKDKSPLRFAETLQGGKQHKLKIRNQRLNVELSRNITVEDETSIVYDFDLSKKLDLTINLYPGTNNRLAIKGPGISKNYENIITCNLSLKAGNYSVSFTAKGIKKDTTYIVNDKIYEIGTKADDAFKIYILEESIDTNSQ